MATKISAVMTVTDANQKTASKSISDIDPNANANAIVDFARALNSLTTNTLGGVELVTRTDILSDYDATDPQLSISPSSIDTYPEGGTSITLQLKYKGNERNVTFSGKKLTGSSFVKLTNKKVGVSTPDGIMMGGDKTATTIITVAAGDGYKEASTQFSFNNLDSTEITDA